MSLSFSYLENEGRFRKKKKTLPLSQTLPVRMSHIARPCSYSIIDFVLYLSKNFLPKFRRFFSKIKKFSDIEKKTETPFCSENILNKTVFQIFKSVKGCPKYGAGLQKNIRKPPIATIVSQMPCIIMV